MGPQAEPGREEQMLATELTEIALANVAPDELPALSETAEEYFADSGTPWHQGADSPLGAGIPVEMLTPYLLWASSVVLPVLGEIVKSLGVDLTKEPLAAWIRRLFRKTRAEATAPVTLTGQQASYVREIIVNQCYRADLPSKQATLIADAIIGGLHVRP